MSHRRLLLITGVIFSFVFFFSRCMQGPAAAADPRGDGYAGMATCVRCHQRIAGSYLHTAHALTSRAADAQTILGPFRPPDNQFIYGPGRRVELQRRDSGFYQVAVTPNGRQAQRFDIAVGSGRKAQTYLYWKGEGVFQLPVSYFLTEHSWANSPHYPVDSIWFGRDVDVGCFECHASYIGTKPMIHTDAFHGIPQYDRATLIYGVDCERCHGPGALHAAWQADHPDDREARYMAKWPELSRQQRLDACAGCHSGAHPGERRSLFYFRPGDTLSNFYFTDPRLDRSPGNTDVHGNQYQLLVASACFLRSKTLECGSCHEPHVQERENLLVYAKRCMHCHGAAAGGLATGGLAAGHEQMGVDTSFLIRHCIDCHMPARASGAITMLTQWQKDPVADVVRSHYITVYPEETRKVLENRGRGD